jgi:hypothetical protein
MGSAPTAWKDDVPEQPAVGAQCHLQLRAPEPTQKPPQRLAMRRHDPRATHLTGRGIDPLGRDLPSMLVKSITIVIRGFLKRHG